MKLLDYFERQRTPVILLEGLALIAVIGIADFWTGSEIGLSILYVIPIALIGWFAGRWLAYLASVLSAAVWLWADIATTSGYSHPLIPLWNSLIRFGFFIIITTLLTALRKALQRERELARIDHLTGAANARSFHDIVQHEIDRCQRYHHPFTLAYIDLDNFKAVNDRLGHSAGNQLLRAVTDAIRLNARKTDLVCRIGGDEFAVLLWETGQQAAHVALGKIQRSLDEKMRKHGWPVTFSIGVLTCNTTPPSVDSLVRLADELMYAVKKDGKNAIRFDCYGAATAGEAEGRN